MKYDDVDNLNITQLYTTERYNTNVTTLICVVTLFIENYLEPGVINI